MRTSSSRLDQPPAIRFTMSLIQARGSAVAVRSGEEFVLARDGPCGQGAIEFAATSLERSNVDSAT
jgi:hypothetical protein